LPEFRASLEPLRRTFAHQDFVSGKAPAYADYSANSSGRAASAILKCSQPTTRFVPGVGGCSICSPDWPAAFLRTHHCEIVETGNESWRFKHRA
jgi:hypothetical protein